MLTDRQRTSRQTDVSKTESTLILSGSSPDTRGSWPILKYFCKEVMLLSFSMILGIYDYNISSLSIDTKSKCHPVSHVMYFLLSKSGNNCIFRNSYSSLLSIQFFQFSPASKTELVVVFVCRSVTESRYFLKKMLLFSNPSGGRCPLK